MNPDNTRLGFLCSFALHACAALAIVLSMFWSMIFPPPDEPPIQAFEMVAPQPETLPEPEIPTPIPQIDAPEAKDIKPLELPPEQIPEPDPKPEPKPSPKPAQEPKPSPKPVERPKRVSYKDFIKSNPKKTAPARPNRTKGKPISAPTVNASLSNIENIADISVSLQTTSAMRDALAAYIAYIRNEALRSWAITGGGLEAKIGFRVSKNGEISGVKILESSGDEEFDKAALKAFSSLRRLNPPPDNAAHTVTIRFKSNY